MKLFNSVIDKLKYGISWLTKLSLRDKVIFTLIAVIVLWFGVKPLIAGDQSGKIQYTTEQAEKGTLVSSVTASGTVSSGSSANISTSVTGIVSDVYVKNGDYVNAGDSIALVTLDTNSQQQQAQAWASYLSAQNNLNSAKSQMNSLQAALFTANQAFVNGAGSQNPDTNDPKYIIQRANWLQAEANYTQQQNVINQAEAALTSAWLSYSKVSPTITAPISGVASDLNITPGLSISGNQSSSNSTNSSSSNSNTGQTIGSIKLENGSPLASVNLSEIDVTKVKVGQKATLTLDAFPDKTFTGHVSSINTTGTTSSGVTSYPVTITFDTAVNNIYSNMAVNATIITDVKDNVLLVPLSAVQTLSGASVVRVMKNGQVTPVDVETGESNDTQIEITSGLQEGDTIITGQTGGTTTQRTTQTSSPFGGTGFGGGRGFGGGAGGGNQIRFQRTQ